ncbi:2-(acetamidomethylene)succinate hydrolase [Spinactinospora alkalitolerans]|uniref:2-(Acetamidomethylene)succinate hydrolase n=1 Tax=Spinactinospora alkalitolerans TaxID=687207 RepID=A0A852TU26_9ACTN|nr:alpha/beta hydrolase [Spinactinospora alkalitolerans]NYE45440.1 2-(acetamidomethylene)succinate hydrolase [Spinactinospora alkalitolerans]
MTADLQHTRSGRIGLCFRDKGTGPTVVLLHGTTASLGVWDPVADRIGDRVRTIAVDQRGHGRSDKPAEGYGVSDYCSDVLALIAELDCGPVVVCGHSLGARNAVVLGRQHPESVVGVVAVDYTPYVEPHVLDDLEARVRGGDRRFDSEAEIEDYLRRRYPLMPVDALRRRIAYGYVREGDGFRALADPAAMVRTVQGLRCDFAAEARDITVPVVLVRGERSRIVSDEAFAATRRLRPDFRAVEVPEADHYIPEENPEVVAGEITRMVQAVM